MTRYHAAAGAAALWLAVCAAGSTLRPEAGPTPTVGQSHAAGHAVAWWGLSHPAAIVGGRLHPAPTATNKAGVPAVNAQPPWQADTGKAARGLQYAPHGRNNDNSSVASSRHGAVVAMHRAWTDVASSGLGAPWAQADMSRAMQGRHQVAMAFTCGQPACAFMQPPDSAPSAGSPSAPSHPPTPPAASPSPVSLPGGGGGVGEGGAQATPVPKGGSGQRSGVGGPLALVIATATVGLLTLTGVGLLLLVPADLGA